MPLVTKMFMRILTIVSLKIKYSFSVVNIINFFLQHFATRTLLPEFIKFKTFYKVLFFFKYNDYINNT